MAWPLELYAPDLTRSTGTPVSPGDRPKLFQGTTDGADIKVLAPPI